MSESQDELVARARAIRDSAVESIRSPDDLATFIDQATPLWDHELDNILLLTHQAKERGMSLKAVTGADQWKALGRTPLRSAQPLMVVNRRNGSSTSVAAAFDVSQTHGAARPAVRQPTTPADDRLWGLGFNVHVLIDDIGWSVRRAKFTNPDVIGEADHARREVILAPSLPTDTMSRESLRLAFAALLYSRRDPYTDHRAQADAEAAAGTRMIYRAHGFDTDPRELSGWKSILEEERPRVRELLARVHSVSRTVLMSSDPIVEGGRPTPTSFDLNRGPQREQSADSDFSATSTRPRHSGPSLG